MPTSSAPSENAAGSHAASAEQQIKTVATAPWFVHDVLLYAVLYLTLWLGDVPAGGGWDALIAAAPVALSQLVRSIAQRAAA